MVLLAADRTKCEQGQAKDDTDEDMDKTRQAKDDTDIGKSSNRE